MIETYLAYYRWLCPLGNSNAHLYLGPLSYKQLEIEINAPSGPQSSQSVSPFAIFLSILYSIHPPGPEITHEYVS